MSDATAEHKTLAEALLAIQREIPAVEPDAVNPHFKSKFVSLGNLISKVRPVLNRHGVAVTQFPSLTDDNQPTLVTVLTHAASGERMEYPAPLFLAKADPQGQGSAITYMRRYALATAFGVVDQEDDDGNAGTEGVQREANGDRRSYPISDKQLGFLESLLKKTDATAQERLTILAWARENLTGGQKGTASTAIEGLKTDATQTLERLTTAAEKWNATQTTDPQPEDSDLPPLEEVA